MEGITKGLMIYLNKQESQTKIGFAEKGLSFLNKFWKDEEAE